MAIKIGDIAREERQDTAANWTSNNPVPRSGEWCIETDTRSLKIGDGTTTWNSLAYLDDLLGVGVGSLLQYATYKDRTSARLFSFDYSNPVSQTTYSRLYAEVGDSFEAQHVAAGDSASGAGMFYPTPIPGKFPRSAIPDLNIDGTTLTLPSGFRNGTLFLVKSGTNQAVGTALYIRRTGVGTVTYHSSEAGAIANTGAITVTGVGVLTQEGIAIDDAMQRITGLIGATSGSGLLMGNNAIGFSDDGALTLYTGTGNARTSDPSNKSASGIGFDSANSTSPSTAKTSDNETRGTQFYSYWYIKF